MPRPFGSSTAPQRLLVAALAAWLTLSAAVGGRALAQASDGPAAGAAGAAAAPTSEPFDSIYGAPDVDACVQLTNSAGQACTVESDTLSLVYPRGSEQLPTPEEVGTAISNMKAAAQPSANCCAQLKPYADARCPCAAGYQQLLPIGGFDPAYFEGATAILAEACNFDFPPCQPGEPIRLDAAKPATPVPGVG